MLTQRRSLALCVLLIAAMFSALVLTSAKTTAAPKGNPALTAAGAPKSDAYDPANQPQGGLVAAASKRQKPVVPAAGRIGNGTPRKAAKAPTAAELLTAGGCRPEYGTRGQCLPIVPPSHVEHANHDMTHAWSCEELLGLFPTGIAVRNKNDVLGLDSNKDGVACAAGDALTTENGY